MEIKEGRYATMKDGRTIYITGPCFIAKKGIASYKYIVRVHFVEALRHEAYR